MEYTEIDSFYKVSFRFESYEGIHSVQPTRLHTLTHFCKKLKATKILQKTTIQNILFVTFFAEQDFKHECHNFYYDILLFFGENCIYSECCHLDFWELEKFLNFALKNVKNVHQLLKRNSNWTRIEFSHFYFSAWSQDETHMFHLDIKQKNKSEKIQSLFNLSFFLEVDVHFWRSLMQNSKTFPIPKSLGWQHSE